MRADWTIVIGTFVVDTSDPHTGNQCLLSNNTHSSIAQIENATSKKNVRLSSWFKGYDTDYRSYFLTRFQNNSNFYYAMADYKNATTLTITTNRIKSGVLTVLGSIDVGIVYNTWHRWGFICINVGTPESIQLSIINWTGTEWVNLATYTDSTSVGIDLSGSTRLYFYRTRMDDSLLEEKVS